MIIIDATSSGLNVASSSWKGTCVHNPEGKSHTSNLGARVKRAHLEEHFAVLLFNFEGQHVQLLLGLLQRLPQEALH